VTAGAFPRTPVGRLDRKRSSRPVVRPLVIFVVAVTIAFFAVIYSRISLDRTAFELQQLDREIAAEEQLHWDLRAEHARLQAPDRITQRAAELGLVYPVDQRSIEVTGVERGVGGPEDRLNDLRALFMEQP
jgi:cell division protein FtsL